ncbi:DUF4440 domain-containing protein [Duganella levis]|uniref:DUF4440 domain-containing protein n=1 Tax=Duganella levis TaxID=2692169 RepID=A0ABW9VVH2_9BURK|nr:DUF4440 domain-containing protein [Duganella levis]MYN25626.1 DUF4440 domain-containing protein [Duganella levis]
MKSLLSELRALEVEFHHPGGRCNTDRLGRTHDRAIILKYLSEQESSPSVISDDFAVSQLAPDIGLLTYRSAHRKEEGSLVDHTLRSSVWGRVEPPWQLRYHQGTPARELWHA